MQAEQAADPAGSAQKSRKRVVEQAAAGGRPAKRPAISGAGAVPTSTSTPLSTPEEQERVRAAVRDLYASYNALISGAGGNVEPGPFQALLQASSAGDTASQRLAARLLPRFITLFPDQVEVCAGALIALYERYQDLEGFDRPLEEHTRRDALQGLQAVLLAASSGTPHGCQAVKLILAVLFRLLPQAELEAPSTDEMTEEEGEVAPQDSAAAAAAGPWVRKALRLALLHHPITTLTFCFGCLGTTASGRNNSSSSSSVGPAVLHGVKLWLKEHILREATPSREGTPMDCDATHSSNGGAAAAAAAGGSSGGGTSNGTSTPRATAAAIAAAAAAAGLPPQPRGCALQSVLESSAELRVWVRKEAKGLSRAPVEAKAVLQAAMQLMPPERPPAAAKRPHPGGNGQQQQQHRGTPPHQQQPPYQQSSPQQQLPQHKAPNGVASRAVNGMDPLNRSWSTPSPGRGQPRGRTALGRPPDPAAAGWGPQFPRPAGPICRLQPCVLLANVPWQLKLQDLQQQLQAVEAWILDQQPPSGAAAGGSSGAPGARACCVLKAPLDAARAYMRHHKANRLGPQCPPTQVLFADSLPSCSRSNPAGAGAQSVYVWALRSVAGDAERVTDDLREAGLVPKSVSRVNHGSDPGTVLEAHSPKEAADILSFLLKTHAAAVAAATQQQQRQDELLPPLPPDPPPGSSDWAGSSSGTPAGSGRGGSKPPATPASAAGGAGASRQPLQQQGQPSGLGGPPPPLQQQQQGTPGFSGGPQQGFRRSNSMPTPGQQQKPGAEANWRHSPGPNAPQQQQQQGRWPSGGGGGGGPPQAAAAAGQQQGGLPPFPGPPGAAQQQQQLQRQHSFASASSPGGGGGSGTPTHAAGSPAGPNMGQVPPPQGPGGGVSGGGGGGPAAAPQYAGSQVMWAGRLYKSEVPVGSVCCVEAAGPARQSGAAPEPLQWPDALHINHRISVADALEHYAAAPQHARAVRVLLPQESPPGNAQAIQSFVQYLTAKGRAGMVKLPAGNGLSARAVYIIVPRTNVCEALRVAWDGRGVMLIVVVVPQGSGGGSSGGGAGPGGGGGHKAGGLPGPPSAGGGQHGSNPYSMHHRSSTGHRPMR